jgi:hypothetical protein
VSSVTSARKPHLRGNLMDLGKKNVSLICNGIPKTEICQMGVHAITTFADSIQSRRTVPIPGGNRGTLGDRGGDRDRASTS